MALQRVRMPTSGCRSMKKHPAIANMCHWSTNQFDMYKWKWEMKAWVIDQPAIKQQ